MKEEKETERGREKGMREGERREREGGGGEGERLDYLKCSRVLNLMKLANYPIFAKYSIRQ